MDIQTTTQSKDRSKPYIEGDVAAETAWESALSREQSKIMYEFAFNRFLFAIELNHPKIDQIRTEYKRASDIYRIVKGDVEKLNLHTQN